MKKSIKKQIIHKFFGRGNLFHPTKNHSKYMERFNQELVDNPGMKIVNIGAGGYDPIPGAVNVDPYRDGPNTVKAFGEDLPFADESFDLAICVGTLEHIRQPSLVLDEIYRVLKSGGKLYVEMPFMQPRHGAPDDYCRLTPNGLRQLCKRFKEIDLDIVNGPGSAIAWLLVEYNQIFFNNKILKRIVRLITKIFVSPLKFIDVWLIKRPTGVNLAGGFYYYGQKP